jgi:hypothetical protein
MIDGILRLLMIHGLREWCYGWITDGYGLWNMVGVEAHRL